LLDSELLAEVYLRLTGGQETLALGAEGSSSQPGQVSPIRRVDNNRPQLNVLRADIEELKSHEERLDVLGEACIWKKDA